MKYIHLELSNLIGLFERTMVQIYIYTRTPTRLHYPARLRARVIIKSLHLKVKVLRLKVIIIN